MMRERLYLLNIVERIEMIRRFTSDGEAAFRTSDMAQEAVIRSLEVIGEAARRLSDDTREQLPDVPWSKMVGLRNLLIHEYDKVDVDQVWRIVRDDLAPVYNRVKAYLQGE